MGPEEGAVPPGLDAIPEGEILCGGDRRVNAAMTHMAAMGVVPHDWNPVALDDRTANRETRITRIGGFLVKQRWFDRDIVFNSLWGRGSSEDLDRLAEECDGLFSRVDSETRLHVEALGRADIDWMLDERFSDYILDLAEQVKLDGRKFGRRRTYLAKVQREVGVVLCGIIDVSTAHVRSAVHEIQRDWVDCREPSRTVVADDDFFHGLIDSTRSSTLWVGVYFDELLVGFGALDVIGPNAYVHHVKAKRSGVAFATTWQTVFEAAHGLGAIELNAGYDGGLVGLQQAKGSLRPCRRLSNYAARLLGAGGLSQNGSGADPAVT